MDEQQKKKHVVLADDDPATRRLFGAKLASAGFEVIYAKDGNEEIEAAKRFLPNLIVADIDMPNVDGIKAAFALKEDPKTKNIPIIFLTNADLSVYAEQSIKSLEGTDYMQKGVDLTEFIERVKKAIGE